MEKDFNKLFYGEDAAQKLKLFKDGMLTIENENLTYFADRISKYNSQEKDRLHNHYLMITNPDGVTFGFNEDSDLDKKIQAECHNLFKGIFNSNN